MFVFIYQTLRAPASPITLSVRTAGSALPLPTCDNQLLSCTTCSFKQICVSSSFLGWGTLLEISDGAPPAPSLTAAQQRRVGVGLPGCCSYGIRAGPSLAPSRFPPGPLLVPSFFLPCAHTEGIQGPWPFALGIPWDRAPSVYVMEMCVVITQIILIRINTTLWETVGKLQCLVVRVWFGECPLRQQNRHSDVACVAQQGCEAVTSPVLSVW